MSNSVFRVEVGETLVVGEFEFQSEAYAAALGAANDYPEEVVRCREIRDEVVFTVRGEA